MVKIRLRRFLGGLFLKANLLTTVCLIIGYIVVSYVLMVLANETAITPLTNFFYWIIVTSSTVGYGDMSPSTSLGKWSVGLWVIPAGLAIFALILAKVGFYFSELALKGRRGLRMLQNKDHTIIIGWSGARTHRLIELLRAKSDTSHHDIVLCVMADIENPLPGKIDFVKVDHFSHEESMKRTNIALARRVIIDTPQDDVTLTTALFCQNQSPLAHITAYFSDEGVASLLKTHCPSVECVPSVGVEMLAKSASDPGSSALHKQLLDSTQGMTQYSVEYTGQPLQVKDIFEHFKREFKATIIGIKPKDSEDVKLNPALECEIVEGDTLYYISDRRLHREQCFESKAISSESIPRD